MGCEDGSNEISKQRECVDFNARQESEVVCGICRIILWQDCDDTEQYRPNGLSCACQSFQVLEKKRNGGRVVDI